MTQSLNNGNGRRDGWGVEERASSSSNIIGQILKCSNGVWKVNNEIFHRPGDKYIANNVASVWVRWEDSKPAEHRVINPGDYYPDRSELGFDDKSQWETGPSGEPSDPWKDTRYLHLICLRTGADFTFISDALGGLRAVGELKAKVGNISMAHASALPVVELATAPWPTKFNKNGRRPSFNVAGWIKGRNDRTPLLLDQKKPQIQQDHPDNGLMDDEIPF
jgi:hypothetical protein